MISFNLLCENNHRFEGWFKSHEAFVLQQKKHLISCPHCQSSNILKTPSAPNVSVKTSSKKSPLQESPVAKLRQFIERSFKNVGNDFTHQARQMHKGTRKAENIYGQVTPEQAKELAEDGVESVTLPWPANSKKLN